MKAIRFVPLVLAALLAVVPVQTLEERRSGNRVIVLVATATSRNIIRISDDLSLEFRGLDMKEGRRFCAPGESSTSGTHPSFSESAQTRAGDSITLKTRRGLLWACGVL